MSISYQLQLITYFFAGFLALLLLLILSGAFGVSTLVQRQNWVNHTNNVLAQVKLTERTYKEADYTSRLRLTTGLGAENLPLEREKTFAAIDGLRAKIADNPEQVIKVDSVKNSIAARFAAQDAQFESTRRNGVTIEFDKALVTQNSELAKSIDLLFINLQLNEIDYMRLERMPRLYQFQWYLVYFTSALVLLMLVVTLVLFFLVRRVLKRNLYVGERMDYALHNGETGDAKKLVRQLEKFRDAILETNDSLNTT